MFDSIPPREPAWPGATGPARPDFTFAVGRDEQRWLCDRALPGFSTGRPAAIGALQGTGRQPDGPPRGPPRGHYLVSLGTARFVAHVKTVAGPPDDLETAAQIAAHVAQHGVPVIGYHRARDGAAQLHVDGRFVTLTPFHQARHTDWRAADATAVGSLLGRAHRALRTFPQSERVRRRTMQVIEDMHDLQSATWQVVPESVPEHLHADVRTAARDYDPQFTADSSPQCGHGDLSPGNVLFTQAGQALLGDFEDAPFTFRPPLFDLAMATLRFALEGPEVAVHDRLDSLIGAYRETGAADPQSSMLKKIALNHCHHALLVMVHLTMSGQTVALEEWAKPLLWRSLLAKHL